MPNSGSRLHRSLRDLSRLPGVPWQTMQAGCGVLEPSGQTLRLVNGDTTTDQYSNAQVDDYQGLSRRQFWWRPPLSMTVRARFSHPNGVLSGTAGFGFWNDPFLMTGWRWPTLPRAVWFFYASPESNMKLAGDVPGRGWKAATIDALRPSFFALAPLAPLAMPLMNLPPLYRRFWPLGQRAIHVQEALIPNPMTDWHDYELHWAAESVRFGVDGQTVLQAQTAPRGPLGFVTWLDNQYMVVTPWGRFAHGLLAAAGEQWLELAALTIKGG